MQALREVAMLTDGSGSTPNEPVSSEPTDPAHKQNVTFVPGTYTESRFLIGVCENRILDNAYEVCNVREPSGRTKKEGCEVSKVVLAEIPY